MNAQFSAPETSLKAADVSRPISRALESCEP